MMVGLLLFHHLLWLAAVGWYTRLMKGHMTAMQMTGVADHVTCQVMTADHQARMVRLPLQLQQQVTHHHLSLGHQCYRQSQLALRGRGGFNVM